MAAIHLHEKTWSVARGGALERICGELVGRRHSHISHFALCLWAAESFRRGMAVGSGPLQVSGSVQRRHGGRADSGGGASQPGAFNQISSTDPDSQHSSL